MFPSLENDYTFPLDPEMKPRQVLPLYVKMILNWSRRQHPTKQQLYGHQPAITKTIHIKRTRHAGHCWRSRDELISDALLWTSSHGRAKAGWPARTYIQQLWEDTGCSRKRWTIGWGGEKESGISVLIARQDDDDDDVKQKRYFAFLKVPGLDPHHQMYFRVIHRT